MPAFSRRNREKFMLTENVGVRSCERVVRASDLQSDKTLHRLGQIMPFVFESVNNVELMQQQFVSRARQTDIHSNSGNLPDPLRPRGAFKYVSNSQQII